jgi:HSP20 family protein
MSKKRPTLWFEEPVDEMKKSQDNFFEGIEKIFSRPNALGKIIKFPDFREGFIPVKIGETDGELLLKASLPGFKKQEIRLRVTPRLVYVSAEKKSASVDKGKNFLRRESSSQSASRILQLPTQVKTEGVKARYKDGELEVVMQKKDSRKEREVDIE